MRPRLSAEFQLLRQVYAGAEHAEQGGEDWFRLPAYRFPPGWRLGECDIAEAPVAFKVVATYPAGEPYGFAVPMELNFEGATPQNAAASVTTPFGETCRLFSWQPDGWFPTDDPRIGSNLLAWARSFVHRLKEGA